MSLINKPAHLKVCQNCGSHAQIIFSDGSESTHFGTIQRGLLLLRLALIEELVTDVEFEEVVIMIYDLPFPLKSAVGDAIADLANNNTDEGYEEVEPEINTDKTDTLILKMMLGPRPSKEEISMN